ncbi:MULTISPECIES: SUMF1/EgtB/PvdO family nonheme iron enzyme [Hyphomicrobiales]|jgi:formylglycine-generating enzyme required for sulfatase activity|uniref:SUMF1/EgtB/PvdO family nonheme iron enzyme n=1 Tax=Bosea massiliensis TaxID=151419 RepID=A0ABW0P0S5_9HYPH|nr:SUMF1/EgtB/PvdO family nonheme iron enzyme [Methylobacterium sp. CCH7-A2]
MRTGLSWWRPLALAVGAMLLSAGVGLAQTGDAGQRRVGLVIGNGAYGSAPVAGATADASAVADTLRAGGFDVVTAKDANAAALQDAIAAFGARLGRGAQAVVFYAGHAVQQRGRNFLVPVDPRLRSAADIARAAVDLDLLLDALIVARPSSALVVLDASRDNPWQAEIGGAGKGLLAIDRMEAISVMFTTAPGRTVADRGNPAVDEWIKAIRTPGLDMQAALARTRDAVARQTRRAQQIWTSSEPPPGLIVTPVARPAQVAQNNRAVIPLPPPESPAARQDAYELAFWESIRSSENPAEYRAYLNAYPDGRFAALARTREQQFLARQNASAAPPAAPLPQPAPPVASLREPPRAPAPPPPAATSARTVRDCDDCPELIAIRPGSFEMGANELYEFEKPVHTVTIRDGFHIGVREVTFDEWDACVDQGGCSHRPNDRGLGRGKRPVTDIHWNDANAYLAWLSARTGKRYRLPSEAEWEYAARGGTTTTYPWGATLVKERANCVGCNEPTRRQAVETGQFPPNGFGLFDMAGNAAEWVADCWSDSYRATPRDGSAFTAPGCRERVLRGGSFNNDPRYLRSAARFKYEADVRFFTNGFRVVREP